MSEMFFEVSVLFLFSLWISFRISLFWHVFAVSGVVIIINKGIECLKIDFIDIF